MKKVININFQGRVIPIEETAYEILKQYVDSLRRYFSNEEGRDEIVNDIESRIAELFGETLKKGSTCITDADVTAIIASIGRPEDFDGEEEKVKERVYEQSNSRYTYTRGDRLFRNENDKVIAGVCGGIASYFGVDPLIVRILFIVFSLGFGFGFLVYLVLWVALPSTSSAVIGSARKRLLRDPDDKIIGGVCRGLSYYFGVNVWIPRALFLIPFFTFVTRWDHWGSVHYPNFISLSFNSASAIIYIILWLVLPEAKSASDRMEMKGEKVDLNSIWNNAIAETKGMGDRVKKFSQEAVDLATETGKKFGTQGKQFSTEVSQTAKRGGRGLGSIIALLVKIFVYFIVGAVLFAVVAALFFFGVAMIGLLPLKEYVLDNGWQTVFAWGTLLCVWIPVIAIVTWLIRRLTKTTGSSTILKAAFWSLWLIGLACVIGLLVSITQDFRYSSSADEQNVRLANAATNKIELHAARIGTYYRRFGWLTLEPFADLDEDTAYVNNLHVRIIKAEGDSFYVKLLKMSDGPNRARANELSNSFVYNVGQNDSILTLSKGIPISSSNKFRNQRVYVTVAVPVGKRIEVDGSVANWYGNIHIGWHGDEDWRYRNDWSDDNDGYSWDHNIEYVMTKDGLKRADGKVSDDDNNDDDDYNNKVEDFNRKREELMRERDERQKELEEKQKELQKYDSILKTQPIDTLPAVLPKTPAVKTASIIHPSTGISSILMTKLAM